MKIFNKKIGIDLDDVIIDLANELIAFLNLKLNLSMKKEHIIEYEIAKVLNIPEEATEKLFEEFYNSQYFKKLRPIKSSIKGINELSKYNELYIITARDRIFYEETIEPIKDIFHSKFESIHFINKFNGNKFLKSDICNALHIDIFIDDSIDNVIDVYQNSNSKVYLFDQPWNRYKIPNKVKRIYSLEDII
jgi:uncharacterized HAD superfamily protein